MPEEPVCIKQRNQHTYQQRRPVHTRKLYPGLAPLAEAYKKDGKSEKKVRVRKSDAIRSEVPPTQSLCSFYSFLVVPG
jgi:hypothetical protein